MARRDFRPARGAMAVLLLLGICALSPARAAARTTTIRIMPPDGAELAVGQRFDLRVEATAPDGAEPPRGLRVTLGTDDITSQNILDPGIGGERGAGGTGAADAVRGPVGRAPAHTTNFLVRDLSFDRPGAYPVSARTADGAEARVELVVHAWARDEAEPLGVQNVIMFVGDGMSLPHRTAARLVSRGVVNGKAAGRLAMDTMEATGVVMTTSLNAVITDSAPGMTAYVTGNKGANNQLGVYPDNTRDEFDNPRVEYLGALGRRVRGPGFNVGLVTTADVTDATPAGNAVHTSNRSAGAGIAAQYFDERDRNGVAVLLGGGSRHFWPEGEGRGARTDGRQLAGEFQEAGFELVTSAAELSSVMAAPQPPARLLGLFHSHHMPVAFDKVGAGRYSDELAQPAHEGQRDQPMLEDMTRAALRSLAAHSPGGFYLMVEGASIDKQAHTADAERTIWDVIELDRAVQAALEFADARNRDGDPATDTLVLVTSDHECGGFAIIGVGNERYAPDTLGAAVRDYAAVFRFQPEQVLDFIPNYEVDADGYPLDPDPSRKLLAGWAAGPDRYENWVSNRLAQAASIVETPAEGSTARPAAEANPARSGPDPSSENRTVGGQAIPGFLVRGTIENGAHTCEPDHLCEGDVPSVAHTIAGHTASDVPLAASGPGALRFTGTYENTDVFFKLLGLLGGEP